MKPLGNAGEYIDLGAVIRRIGDLSTQTSNEGLDELVTEGIYRMRLIG